MSSSTMPFPEEQTTSSLASGLKPLLESFSYPRLPTDYAALINSRWQKLAAGAERLPAKLVAVKSQTADSCSLELKPGVGWRGHQAGQFINLHVNIDGVWHNRCYSISSSDKASRRLQITVRATANGFVSNYLVHQAKVGERLHISQAKGEFVLPAVARSQDTNGKLFITAGSGITPVMGILNSLPGSENCEHIHYERSAEKFIFSEALSELHRSEDNDYRLYEMYTAADEERFSAKQLDVVCPDWRQRDVWACGPASLLDAVEQHWQDEGLAHQLRTERFQALTAQLSDDAIGGTALFAASDVSAEGAADESLLLVAERAGLKPEHGCRMGICHSCDCTLVSGAVRDLRTGQVIDQVGVRIQPCVTAAAGPVSLDL